MLSRYFPHLLSTSSGSRTVYRYGYDGTWEGTRTGGTGVKHGSSFLRLEGRGFGERSHGAGGKGSQFEMTTSRIAKAEEGDLARDGESDLDSREIRVVTVVAQKAEDIGDVDREVEGGVSRSSSRRDLVGRGWGVERV